MLVLLNYPYTIDMTWNWKKIILKTIAAIMAAYIIYFLYIWGDYLWYMLDCAITGKPMQM